MEEISETALASSLLRATDFMAAIRVWGKRTWQTSPQLLVWATKAGKRKKRSVENWKKEEKRRCGDDEWYVQIHRYTYLVQVILGDLVVGVHDFQLSRVKEDLGADEEVGHVKVRGTRRLAQEEPLGTPFGKQG